MDAVISEIAVVLGCSLIKVYNAKKKKKTKTFQ